MIIVSPNPRLQRTRVGPSGRRSPLSRQPLGAAIKSVGRACGESPVPRVRSEVSLRRRLLPHRRPGPVGFWLKAVYADVFGKAASH
jgi:hypothetical protein